jgi:hypothetical protein
VKNAIKPCALQVWGYGRLQLLLLLFEPSTLNHVGNYPNLQYTTVMVNCDYVYKIAMYYFKDILDYKIFRNIGINKVKEKI